MTETKRDPNELGALWLKEGKKGQFLSGRVGDLEVICFPVTGGGLGTHLPAWRVLKSDGRRASRTHERPVDPGPDDPFA